MRNSTELAVTSLIVLGTVFCAAIIGADASRPRWVGLDCRGHWSGEAVAGDTIMSLPNCRDYRRITN